MLVDFYINSEPCKLLVYNGAAVTILKQVVFLRDPCMQTPGKNVEQQTFTSNKLELLGTAVVNILVSDEADKTCGMLMLQAGENKWTTRAPLSEETLTHWVGSDIKHECGATCANGLMQRNGRTDHPPKIVGTHVEYSPRLESRTTQTSQFNDGSQDLSYLPQE
ncbi:hypothetical protein PR048_032000 [Dryococelus australis]|uniref:Uncharacterized protein n=1 Tax=Dryococelus australis TaxID=614101 RepID=A0ABQ9G6V3_9NEOP|nr:hypothetical protein PR048_032000 [Dryococelus australis]